MKKEIVEEFIKENNETIKKMNKEKAIIDNLNNERVATLVEKETLADKRIASIRGDELPRFEWDLIPTKDVKEFIKELKDFAWFVTKDMEKEVQRFFDFLSKKAGKGLLK